MRDSLLNDLRIATRQLLRTKGFTVTAILTLALGLGANTAMFTLVHAVLLQTLPVAKPEQLLRLGDSDNCCVIGGYQKRFSIFRTRSISTFATILPNSRSSPDSRPAASASGRAARGPPRLR